MIVFLIVLQSKFLKFPNFGKKTDLQKHFKRTVLLFVAVSSNLLRTTTIFRQCKGFDYIV